MADIKSTNNNNNKISSNCTNDGPGSMCKVCGDRASGKHYGVPSCDGCRGFFKRSIRRNLEYVCKEGGKCTVDVSRRNQCQSCRFAKCLQANMRREAVQHERAPRTCIGGGVTQMNTHHHHHNIGGIPIDVYAAAHSRRFPLHSNGIILPLPIHINTFSSFDQSRFIVPPVNQNNNRNNTDHNNNNNNTTIIDAFQFGNGVFTPPTTSSCSSISIAGVTSPTVNTSTPLLTPPSPSSLNTSALTNTESTNNTGGSITKMNKLNYFTTDNIFGYHNSIINNHFSSNVNRRYYPSNNIIINNSSVSTTPTTIAKDDNEVSSSAEEIPLSDHHHHHHHHHHHQQQHLQSTNLSHNQHCDNQNNQNTENSANNEALFETAAKLLFLSVKWAKTTPSFAQINSKDQKLLLEESWAELFVITSAQYGLSIDGIITTKDLRVHRLQKIINQIVLLRLDQTEAACLKALILFRPDCYGLSTVHQVSMLQEQTLNLLLDRCGGIRAAHLLLTLPCIRSAADPQLLQELLFKKTVGEVAIERLLGDLIRN